MIEKVKKMINKILYQKIFYHNLWRLIFTPISTKKRILGIWDFKALPWSIGDPLTFVETLSVIKLENDVEAIDICVVYDREDPGGNRAKFRGTNLTVENSQDYMLDFLPLFSTCPYLGSIYQFNSRKEFYRFLKCNMERYHLYPPLSDHLGEKYNFYGGAHLREIQKFYRDHGYVPHLRIGERERSWAYSFYLKYLPKKALPVTLALKQTSHVTERNADQAVWLAFIDKCKEFFPEVVFVVVGLREEGFDGLRTRTNVIVAKDFGTSIIEDLALIRTSLLFMATTSGVVTIALYSDLPYLIFQMPGYTMRRIGQKPGENLYFATNRQKLFDDTTMVTPELLFNEFKGIYNKLERSKWRSISSEKACPKYGHPSTKVTVNEEKYR